MQPIHTLATTTTYPTIKVDSPEAIEPACQQVSSKIEILTRRYQTIDISETMQKLSTVGDLIRLSLAGSQGFKCSVPIMEISCNYQTLINNSFMASTKFMEVSLQSIKKHELALLCVEKNKPEKALEQVSKTAEMAAQMEGISSELVLEATQLSDLAKTALLLATEDNVVTKEEKEKTEKLLVELDAGKQELAETSKQLSKNIEEERAKEQQIARQAHEQRNKKVGIFDTVIEVATGQSGRQAALDQQKARELDEKELKVAEARRQLQQQQLEANAKLRESVTLLQGTAVHKDSLESSIVALEITVQTLGKIRTVFENVRVFWCGVKEHCKKLSDVEEIKDKLEIDHEEFILSIQESGLGWLALGKVNYVASVAMSEVAKTLASHMKDLPTSSKAPKLIEDLSQKLLSQIENDDRVIREIAD